MTRKKKILLLFYTCAMLFLVWIVYRQYQRDNYITQMLKQTSITKAIIIKICDGAVRNSKRCEYIYKINKKKYTYQTRGDFSYLKVGDTIQIKYSLKDPSIATVYNTLIMKRFK
jgi:hypothetical protein